MMHRLSKRPFSHFERFARLSKPQHRTLFGGINQIIDKKFPDEASPDFSQPSLMAAPVLLSHGVLGSLLSYPVIAEALTREQGILESVSGDWDIIETSLPLSLGFMLSGLVSSFFGGAIASLGPRKALLGSAVCIGSGLAVSAVGVYMHTLPVLYFGFGTSVGAGVGLCYASPIQTLMLWFPENKGICGGMAASAVGLGAVLSREGLERLLKVTATLPEYLGPSSDFEIIRDGKRLMVEMEGGGGSTAVSVVEVVTAGQESAASALSLPAVQEGLYLVGAGGSTGAVGALAAMSVLSFSALATSATLIRTPPKEYSDDSHSGLFFSPLLSELTSRESKSEASGNGSGGRADDETLEEVNFFSAIRSRNFHILGAMLACTGTSGLGLMTLSNAIMTEGFSSAFPELISPAFLDNHALGLCAAGIFGAGFWSSLSDFVGNRKALVLMLFLTSPAFLALPYCTSLAIESGSPLPVFLSVGASAVAMTSLGGIVATMPAYCAELYGAKNVTATLGGLLAYSTLAATFAPYLYVKLHQLSEQQAAMDLLSTVSPESLQQTFGASLEGAQSLVQSGTVSLAEVYAMLPPGTADPTPCLYDTTLYSFAGLMTISALSHTLIADPSVAKAPPTSPYTPLPEKVPRRQEAEGKQFRDRRKKKKH